MLLAIPYSPFWAPGSLKTTLLVPVPETLKESKRGSRSFGILGNAKGLKRTVRENQKKY